MKNLRGCVGAAALADALNPGDAVSGTGIVFVVLSANEPDNNKPARKVIINLAGGARTSFFIPVGNDPPVGATIRWWPHNAWIDGTTWRVHKLTWEADPDAPLSPT